MGCRTERILTLYSTLTHSLLWRIRLLSWWLLNHIGLFFDSSVKRILANRSPSMWIVDAPSPASSAPPTPKLAPELALPTSATASPPSPFSGPVAGLPSSVTGGSLGGRLSGVVSLTDILNLFARNAGLSPVDPNETRRQRRRSSSTSMRASIDGGRGSIDLRELREHRGSIEIRR